MNSEKNEWLSLDTTTLAWTMIFVLGFLLVFFLAALDKKHLHSVDRTLEPRVFDERWHDRLKELSGYHELLERIEALENAD